MGRRLPGSRLAVFAAKERHGSTQGGRERRDLLCGFAQFAGPWRAADGCGVLRRGDEFGFVESVKCGGDVSSVQPDRCAEYHGLGFIFIAGFDVRFFSPWVELTF